MCIRDRYRPIHHKQMDLIYEGHKNKKEVFVAASIPVSGYTNAAIVRPILEKGSVIWTYTRKDTDHEIEAV